MRPTPDATADADYSSISTVLTFTAGQTAQTVAVETIGDTAVEGTEDYQVQLSGQSSGTIAQPTVTTDIVDGDRTSLTGYTLSVTPA